MGELHHWRRDLTDPRGWVAYLSHDVPKRLIVFVHGFAGRAVGTWQRFPEGGRQRAWWRDSDLLFVGYDSRRENITGVAARLRRELPRFYPVVRDDLVVIDDVALRPPGGRYDDLVIAGHSLGGVVVRRALCDAAERWIDERRATPDAPRPALLDARVCLFSPASAGFRAAGILGLAQASSVWTAVDMFLRRSSSFTDLQPDSQILESTRRRTEELVSAHRDALGALRPAIVWANPDNVVLTERYSTDPVDDAIDGRTHSSVCKPEDGYDRPWSFIESGEPA